MASCEPLRFSRNQFSRDVSQSDRCGAYGVLQQYCAEQFHIFTALLSDNNTCLLSSHIQFIILFYKNVSPIASDSASCSVLVVSLSQMTSLSAHDAGNCGDTIVGCI